MKTKFLLILIIFIVGTIGISAVAAESQNNPINFTTNTGFKLNIDNNNPNYTIQKIGNINFRVPLKYIKNNDVSNDTDWDISITNPNSEYVIFSINKCPNIILYSNYGMILYFAETYNVENKTIDGHPASIVQYKIENGKNRTSIYFPSNDYSNIYYITYDSNLKGAKKEAYEIIKNTPNSTLTSEEFNKKLDNASNEYLKEIYAPSQTGFTIVNTIDTSNRSHQKIGDVEFKIPIKYLKGDNILNGSYYILNNNIFTFAIREIYDNDFLKSSYGDDASSSNTYFIENKTIGKHPATIIYQTIDLPQAYYDIHQYNVTYVYFVTGTSIYCISYNGTELTPDIEKMIKETPKSTMSESKFYSMLDRAEKNYIKDYDQESQDYTYDLIEQNTKSKNKKGIRGIYVDPFIVSV